MYNECITLTRACWKSNVIAVTWADINNYSSNIHVKNSKFCWFSYSSVIIDSKGNANPEKIRRYRIPLLL